MTLTFELDTDSVMMNWRARYLGQRSFGSTKVIVGTHNTQTGLIALPGPLNRSVVAEVLCCSVVTLCALSRH